MTEQVVEKQEVTEECLHDDGVVLKNFNKIIADCKQAKCKEGEHYCGEALDVLEWECEQCGEIITPKKSCVLCFGPDELPYEERIK